MDTWVTRKQYLQAAKALKLKHPKRFAKKAEKKSFKKWLLPTGSYVKAYARMLSYGQTGFSIGGN